MKKVTRLAVTACLAVALTDALDACSTFCLDLGGKRFFGRNYDFDIGDGLVMVNPSGLRKQGSHAGGPAWTARHGSVTFNQFGRDNPMGGMNTAGLVVELMWLDEARYPSADRRAPLGVLEWIQYQLDTAATVADVLASDRTVRIQGRVPLHYLVSDAKGAGATIEYLDGRLVSHSGPSMPVGVLTNSTYADSLRFTRERGGSVAAGDGSLERFARVVGGLETVKQNPPKGSPAAALFAVLAGVAQGNTRWSIVYDQTERTLAFRTSVQAEIRSLDMKGLDFSCAAGVRMMDIDAAGTGDVRAKLAPYSPAAHLAMVRKSYAGSSVTRGIPDAEVASIAAHAEKATCGT